MLNLTDDELIAKIQAGDMRAFNILFTRYKKPVFSFIYHLLPNRAEAEDVFQEVFLRVIGSIKDYQHQGKFSSWVIKIANNLVIDKFRKEGKADSVSLETPVNPHGERPVELKDTIPAKGTGPDALYEKQELREAITQAVEALPTEQKQVFLMREESGLSFKEIAEVLGCSINTALGRMHYAMDNLKKKLTPIMGADHGM